jgi:hypothetical protein
VAATTPDLVRGDLPLSPMFLPLVHTSVSYLAGTAVADLYGETFVNAPLTFEVPQGRPVSQEGLRVAMDGGRELRPVVTPSPQGGVRVTCEDPAAAGFYALAADSVVLAEAAVNVDAREGDLTPLPIESAVGGRVSVVEAGEDFLDDLEEARQGREVFAAFLVLALAALVAESLLGRKA